MSKKKFKSYVCSSKTHTSTHNIVMMVQRLKSSGSNTVKIKKNTLFMQVKRKRHSIREKSCVKKGVVLGIPIVTVRICTYLVAHTLQYISRDISKRLDRKWVDNRSDRRENSLVFAGRSVNSQDYRSGRQTHIRILFIHTLQCTVP